MLASDSALKPWLRAAREYVEAMPPKAEQVKKAAKTVKKAPRAATAKPAKRR
jgi:uncharacterized protein YukE